MTNINITVTPWMTSTYMFTQSDKSGGEDVHVNMLLKGFQRENSPHVKYG